MAQELGLNRAKPACSGEQVIWPFQISVVSRFFNGLVRTLAAAPTSLRKGQPQNYAESKQFYHGKRTPRPEFLTRSLSQHPLVTRAPMACNCYGHEPQGAFARTGFIARQVQAPAEVSHLQFSSLATLYDFYCIVCLFVFVVPL